MSIAKAYDSKGREELAFSFYLEYAEIPIFAMRDLFSRNMRYLRLDFTIPYIVEERDASYYVYMFKRKVYRILSKPLAYSRK